MILKSLFESAIVQAFVGAVIAVALLTLFERLDFFQVMYVGGGALLASVVFLGILAYRLGQDYVRRSRP